MRSDHKYSTDEPLSIGAKDLLGTDAYCAALYQFIRTCETPITIGIQGDWGSGKTSVINQIIRRLDSEVGRGVKIPHVCVNTWQYAQFRGEELLGPALIKGLLAEIEKKCGLEPTKTKKAKEAIGTVLRGLSAGVSVGGVSFDAGKALRAATDDGSRADFAETMKDFREDFSGVVEAAVASSRRTGGVLPDRLVVFIDDLDRVPPLRALELLEAVKNFLDVQKCVFVLAVDYEVVQAGMRQKLGDAVQLRSGKSFFDKIIQLPFNMPQDVFEVGEYATRLLEKNESLSIPKGRREDWVPEVEELLSLTVGRNPRSIKRVANYAGLMELVRKERRSEGGKITQSQRRQLLALICMQIAWPELASYFFRHASRDLLYKLADFNFVKSIPGFPNLMARFDDVLQLQSNVAAFADLLIRWITDSGSDEVSGEEFGNFHQLMLDSQLTRIEHSEPPLRRFLGDAVRQNCELAGDASAASQIRQALYESDLWNEGAGVVCKASGTRLVSVLTARGRQLASVVSMKSQPLVVRFVMSQAEFRDAIREWACANQDLDNTGLDSLVKNADVRTGFGDAMLNLDKMVKLIPERLRQIAFLDACLETVLKGQPRSPGD